MRNRTSCMLLLAIVLASCDDSRYSDREAAPRIDSPNISEVQVELPSMDGKELLMRYCMPCHSLRYIEMQPEMTRLAWEKTVTKMVKSYGAPMPDSQTAQRIVDYLYQIKGKPQPAAAR